MPYHQLRRLFAAGIVAAAFCGAPVLAGPPSPFNWSGFYIGVNGGGMNYKTDGAFPHAPVAGFVFATDKKEAGLGGIHVGYQGQWGNIVVGIEGAWDAALGGGYSSKMGGFPPLGAPCTFVATIFCQARINDIIQVGPRAGFAMGQWLVYGTGGYARALIDSQLLNGALSNFPASNHHDGWYAGGGLEFLATNNFIIGAEYKHFDLGSAPHDFPAISTFSRNVNAKADAVLVRLTIKGGG
jgi:outer membrane immunogenic protein